MQGVRAATIKKLPMKRVFVAIWIYVENFERIYQKENDNKLQSWYNQPHGSGVYYDACRSCIWGHSRKVR